MNITPSLSNTPIQTTPPGNPCTAPLNVPKLKLDYIRDKTHPSYKNLVKLGRDVNYIWWGN